MRRFGILFTTVFLLVLCGCAKQQSILPCKNDFSCNVHVTYGEYNFEGLLSVETDGKCKIKLMSPDILKGFTLFCNNGKLFAEYFGVKSEITLSDATETAFIFELYECLMSIPDDTVILSNGSEYVYEGHCGNTVFELCFNENGLPRKLSVESQNLVVEFFEYK